MTVLPTLFAHQQQNDLPLHEQLVRTLRGAILADHQPQHSHLPASRMWLAVCIPAAPGGEARWTQAANAQGFEMSPISQF